MKSHHVTPLAGIGKGSPFFMSKWQSVQMSTGSSSIWIPFLLVPFQPLTPCSASLSQFSQEDSHAVLESGTLLPRAYVLILPSVWLSFPPDTSMIHSLYLLQIFPPMPFLSEAFPRPHNAKLQVTLNPPMLYLLYSMHCHLTFVFYLLMYLFLQLSPPDM